MEDWDKSPMGYHNPYMRNEERAKFAVCGRDPDNKGGGILFWAYSTDEATAAVNAYRRAGYLNVCVSTGKE